MPTTLDIPGKPKHPSIISDGLARMFIFSLTALVAVAMLVSALGQDGLAFVIDVY